MRANIAMELQIDAGRDHSRTRSIRRAHFGYLVPVQRLQYRRPRAADIFSQVIIETADLLTDALGSNVYSTNIMRLYNYGVQNYTGRPSQKSVSEMPLCYPRGSHAIHKEP